MKQSFEYRRKFLFYIHLLAAMAERADDKRADESDELVRVHQDILSRRFMIHDSRIPPHMTD